MSDLPADIMRQAQNIVLDCFPGRQTRNVKLEKAIARAIHTTKEQARREALEESWRAVAAALGNETQAVQRRARSAIRSLIPAEQEEE